MVVFSIRGGEAEDRLVPGTLVDVGGDQEPVFYPGQMFGGGQVDEGEENDAANALRFIAGQWGLDGDDVDAATTFLLSQPAGEGGALLRGQTVRAAGDKAVFVQGEVVVNPKTGQPQFVPGKYDEESGKFVPGMVVDTIDGPMFVEGVLHRVNGGCEAIFVPGKMSPDGTRFVKAEGPSELSVQKITDPAVLSAAALDGGSLSVAAKMKRPRNGFMIRHKADGALKFYEDGEELPSDDEIEEMTRGRMEPGADGLSAFTPGLSMDLNGQKTFIPGKVMQNEDGSATFVPGKVVHTKNGPKFVSGQVIQTEEGEKFLPGVVVDDKEKGKVFVPGMEIQTKSGKMFIPGQVKCRTE